MQLDDIENDRDIQVPPVVLVKKTYPKFRKRQKHRLWKLKHLEKEDGNEAPQGEDAPKPKKKRGAAHVDQKFEKDYAMFLQDIEEDPELRGQIDLYKVRVMNINVDRMRRSLMSWRRSLLI